MGHQLTFDAAMAIVTSAIRAALGHFDSSKIGVSSVRSETSKSNARSPPSQSNSSTSNARTSIDTFELWDIENKIARRQWLAETSKNNAIVAVKSGHVEAARNFMIQSAEAMVEVSRMTNIVTALKCKAE